MTTNTEVDSRLIEQLFVLEKGDADHYRILFIDYSNPEVTFEEHYGIPKSVVAN